MDRRLRNVIVASAVAGALLLGLIAGVALKISDRILSGPDPESVVNSSLESMRAQNRLVPFVARYVSVTSSRQDRFGILSAERTLILPGTVRYELDLAKIDRDDLEWDKATSTLNLRLPEIEIAGPEVDLAASREYGDKGILSAVTNTEERLDNANRALAIADLRKQAAAPVPMRLAREAARAAVERSFAMPLQAAGIDGARVVALFPGEEGAEDPSYLDRSATYNEAIAEARRRRAAEGR